MAQTLLANIVNPEVMADMIDKKLTDLIKFAPLADIDYTLQGRPGDTITLPSWNYIGDANTLTEGSSLNTVVLSAGKVNATIHKVAQGVEITDEAVLSGFGDPLGEAASQLALAIASRVDNEVLGILHAIDANGLLYNTANNNTVPAVTDIIPALTLFGEDIEDGPTVALVNPTVYQAMRTAVGANTWIPASEIAAGIAVKGVVGEFAGCQVMVSNKLKTDAAGAGDIYLVKPGALRIFLKRDTLVESDRDILKFTTTMTASKHFVAYLYNAKKAVRIATAA
jgi:N4-gp56 family major capsid protein